MRSIFLDHWRGEKVKVRKIKTVYIWEKILPIYFIAIYFGSVFVLFFNISDYEPAIFFGALSLLSFRAIWGDN